MNHSEKVLTLFANNKNVDYFDQFISIFFAIFIIISAISFSTVFLYMLPSNDLNSPSSILSFLTVILFLGSLVYATIKLISFLFVEKSKITNIKNFEGVFYLLKSKCFFSFFINFCLFFIYSLNSKTTFYQKGFIGFLFFKSKLNLDDISSLNKKIFKYSNANQNLVRYIIDYKIYNREYHKVYQLFKNNIKTSNIAGISKEEYNAFMAHLEKEKLKLIKQKLSNFSI